MKPESKAGAKAPKNTPRPPQLPQPPAPPTPPPAAPTDLPAPPWASRENQRRRRLTFDIIIDGALTIIDTDGVEALTMRRLATSLGVTASSLYQHVKDKETLVQACFHQVIDAVARPKNTGNWRNDLTEYFIRLYERLLTHADLAGQTMGMVVLPTDPSKLRDVEWTLARLCESGISPPQAAVIFDHLMQFTAARVQAHYVQKRSMEKEEYARYLEQFMLYIEALSDEEFPYLKRGFEADLRESVAIFVDGLNLIFDGVESRQKIRDN